MPGQAKTSSTTKALPISEANSSPRMVSGGTKLGRSMYLNTRIRLGHAEGAARLDVVLARDIDHRRAGDAGDLAHGRRAPARAAGSSRWRSASPNTSKPPVEQGVDGQEAGDLRARNRGSAAAARSWAGCAARSRRGSAAAARGRSSASPPRQMARMRTSVVGPPVLPARRRDAERHAEHEGDGDGHQHQFERRGEGLADIVVHRPFGQQRAAEVAPAQPDDEQAVLLDDRLVEAKLLLQVGDLLGGGGRAERHARRIAGDDSGDREDDDRQAHEDEDRPQYPPRRKEEIPGIPKAGPPCSDQMRGAASGVPGWGRGRRAISRSSCSG